LARTGSIALWRKSICWLLDLLLLDATLLIEKNSKSLLKLAHTHA
jgi:hypothetical protein